MLTTARSDAELVREAQRGSAPAFAVLLHRHAAAVRAAVTHDDDPPGAVTATFVRAMRRLPDRDPDEPVEPWLLGLADKEVRRLAPVPEQGPPPMDVDELDGIWAELDLRWPNGRVPRHVPRWIGALALVIVLLALGVLVPYVTLTTAVEREPQQLVLEETVAQPFDEEADREPADELFDPDGATEDGATEDDATGDDATGDDATGDDATGDDATGDDATGDDATGDDATEDDATGDDATDDVAGDDVADSDALGGPGDPIDDGGTG